MTTTTSPTAAVPHPTAPTVQILCVAADRREAEFVRDELMKIAQDFNVEASCTLQDAIARVEDPLRYDAVLFDVHLQGGGALSELTQLGELDGGPAVIMMGDEERCRTAFPAADAYVVKDQDYLVRLPAVVQGVLPRRPESVVSRQAPALTGTVSNASERNNRREVRKTAAVAHWPRLTQEWNAERQRLVASLRSAEFRYERSEQERARDRQQQDSSVRLVGAFYEELSAQGGKWEGLTNPWQRLNPLAPRHCVTNT